MSVAREERRLLCDLFAELGPDAPTRCEGWQTRDLAAHLALRERRPDAAIGIAVSSFAGRTRRVQESFAARPWAELVDLVRSGPPRWSPYAITAVDGLVNAAEFFIHHEDVRRAREDWQPRPPESARDEVLWRNVTRAGRLTYRRSPVGVALRRPDGTEATVRRGPNTATVVGEPGELLLHAFGRDRAVVEFDGEQSSIAVVQGLDRGM
ncbi:TIGR03085 family protein [Solihabitans fulvus]|uniref:TIGR03085 family protein n=1 Tax=Solihabitans fulvus TaxID=1892852 RepID=A0A5B2X5Y3_9PSEU|nr:TIGR03085 family metal-binding protein [Solihabitans fulvus]KAA2258616.1 TIGR03085 family protein [Solihabitans fulvus]